MCPIHSGSLYSCGETKVLLRLRKQKKQKWKRSPNRFLESAQFSKDFFSVQSDFCDLSLSRPYHFHGAFPKFLFDLELLIRATISEFRRSVKFANDLHNNSQHGRTSSSVSEGNRKKTLVIPLTPRIKSSRFFFGHTVRQIFEQGGPHFPFGYHAIRLGLYPLSLPVPASHSSFCLEYKLPCHGEKSSKRLKMIE